jgi:hypothetical protein
MDICDMCDCTHYEIPISQMAIHFYVVFIFPLSWSGISCKIKQEMFNLHENMGTSLFFQWRRRCSCFFSGVGAAPVFRLMWCVLLVLTLHVLINVVCVSRLSTLDCPYGFLNKSTGNNCLREYAVWHRCILVASKQSENDREAFHQINNL